MLKDLALSFLWRKKVRHCLQQLEGAPALALTSDEDALWSRISLQIEGSSLNEPQRALRFRKSRALSLGLACISILIAAVPFMQEESTFSNKSSPEEAHPLPPSTLTFAIVKKDGVLVRGSNLAKLHQGEALIFHVETPGLHRHSKFRLEVVAYKPQGTHEKIVESYEIVSRAEPLKGAAGFIVYKPETVGTYRFDGKRTLGAFSDKIPGFTVELVD